MLPVSSPAIPTQEPSHGQLPRSTMSQGTIPPVMTYPTKITFGEMRASGVRDVLIYCRDHRCSHHVEANADR